MTDDGLTETQRAFLQSQYHREAFEDMSAADINRMDMSTYARLTGRATLGYAVAQVVETAPPGMPRQAVPAQIVPQAPTPEGIDFANLSMSDYAALRGQLGIGHRGEYGRGALDGGSTADWVQAAQRKPGRSAWQGRNVVEGPRLEGRFLRQDEQRDSRSLAERFSTPGNSFSI